jgi:hypothetical protein
MEAEIIAIAVNECAPTDETPNYPTAPEALPISNVPLRVPTQFEGRDEALEQTAAVFQSRADCVAIVTLFGMPGVGKTTLAAAYADRNRKQYETIWWVRAERSENIKDDLQELGIRLGWTATPNGPDLVLERLSIWEGSILIVFDNVPDVRAVRPFLPRGGNSRVLITSTSPAWRAVGEPIEVRVWAKEVGARYLMTRIGQTSETDAAEDLSRRLEGLPLAHELAGAYCERLRLTIAEYVRRFDTDPAALLDDKRHTPQEYYNGRTVAKAFDLAISAANKIHPSAEQLIYLIALLGPHPIACSFFQLGHVAFEEPLRSAVDRGELEEIIAVVRDFGLLANRLDTPYYITDSKVRQPKPLSNKVYDSINLTWLSSFAVEQQSNIGTCGELNEQKKIDGELRLHSLVRLVAIKRNSDAVLDSAERQIAQILSKIADEWQLREMAEAHARCKREETNERQKNTEGSEDRRNIMRQVLRIIYALVEDDDTDRNVSILNSYDVFSIYMKMKWGGFYYRYD